MAAAARRNSAPTKGDIPPGALRSPRESIKIMKSDVSLVLDKDHYVAGDVISGYVQVLLTQEVKIKDLLVHFYGYSRVSWDERRTYSKGSATSVSHKNTENYLSHDIVLLKRDKLRGSTASLTNRRLSGRPSVCAQLLQNVTSDSDEGVFIPPGEHTFDFKLTLPKNLPSSYEAKWGQLKYGVRAVLERPWKFDIERDKEFTVYASIDLNEEPELVRPIAALGDFETGVLCLRRGRVNVELRVGRRGYAPGESVPFYVEVENHSAYKLNDVRVALVQHALFRAGNKTKTLTNTLTSLNRGEISPSATITWENDSLPIPNTPPTTCKAQKAIQIKYTVTLYINYISWKDDYTLSVNVVVGTIGLKKSTIVTYMNLLGYSLTPKDSPAASPRMSQQGCRLFAFTKGDNRGKHVNRQSVPAVHGIPRDQIGMRRASAFPGTGAYPGRAQAHMVNIRRKDSYGSDSLDSQASNEHLLSVDAPSPSSRRSSDVKRHKDKLRASSAVNVGAHTSTGDSSHRNKAGLSSSAPKGSNNNSLLSVHSEPVGRRRRSRSDVTPDRNSPIREEQSLIEDDGV